MVVRAVQFLQLWFFVCAFILMPASGLPALAATSNNSPPVQTDNFSDLASIPTDQLNRDGKAKITGNAGASEQAAGIRMLEAAVARNDAQSMFDLGEFLWQGVSVTPDIKRGLNLLEQAGRAGNGAALLSLGELYLWGDKVRGPTLPDGAKAKPYLEQAIKAGNLEAQRILGEELIAGWNLAKDPPKGVALLEDAISRGDKKSSLSLGKFYFEGQYLKDKSDLGKTMLLKLADEGDTNALVALGSVYMWGGAVPANPALVLEYLKKAESAGNLDAKRILGEQLIGGFCVPQDAGGGVARLKELISLGDVEAKRILGENLISGWAIEKNFPEGVKLLEEASKSGNAKATFDLAKALAENAASQPDVKRGHEMLSSLAKDGNGEALEYLGTQLIWKAVTPGDQKEAERLLTLAGNAGQGSAWLTLAQGASFGKLGPAGKNKYQIFASKARTARQGGIDVFDAQRWMWGMNSRKPNWPKAISLLERSANTGNADAAITLIGAIRDGDGWSVAPNPRNARALLDKYGHIFLPSKLKQQQLLLQSMSIKKLADFSSFTSTVKRERNVGSSDFFKDLFKLNKALATYVLQERLQREKIYTGPLNGKFTPATQNAVRQACSSARISVKCGSIHFSSDILAQLAAQ